MCGRYTLWHPARLVKQFGLAGQPLLPPEPRYNIAPSQDVPVIVASPDGRTLRAMRWGFQPGWMGEPRQPPPINARAETLLDRPLFRQALLGGRCVLPADGFYEWVQGKRRGQRQAMHIRLKGAELFGLAGLTTTDPNGRPTCAIVTTSANELIAPIHPRMPVILAEPEQQEIWLDPSAPLEAVLGCLQSYPADQMEAFPVGQLVSSPRNDGPQLLEASDAAQPATQPQSLFEDEPPA